MVRWLSVQATAPGTRGVAWGATARPAHVFKDSSILPELPPGFEGAERDAGSSEQVSFKAPSQYKGVYSLLSRALYAKLYAN